MRQIDAAVRVVALTTIGSYASAAAPPIVTTQQQSLLVREDSMQLQHYPCRLMVRLLSAGSVARYLDPPRIVECASCMRSGVAVSDCRS